jgi:branched-chain amino acid transport system permease protein
MTATLERVLPNPTTRRIVGWVLPLAALTFAVTVWPFPAPLGVIVNGALVGSRVALIALGIALVYRANRVINFSAGDLGQLPATLAVLLVLSWGWNFYVSAGVGLAAAILLGFLVERLIIRRFYKSPRLVVTVATIGIAQLLTAVALFMPDWFGDLQVAPRLDPPFTMHLSLPGVIFNAADLTTAFVVPVCFVALALFMQRSSFGTAIRGAAERGDRAATLGVPVMRLNTIVWVIASVLAFVAMFLRATVVGLPVGQVLGPSFLLQALAAAVIGRMERLPTIAIAAIGIGVIDQAMTFQPGNRPSFNDVAIFIIVLGALLLTRKAKTVRGGDVSTWQAAREVRPIPQELARLPEVRYVRWALAAIIGGLLLALPLWLSESKINLAAVIVIFGIVGLSLVVLTGWAGQVSLGQMAFAGIGAAVGGALTTNQGWDISLALLVGGLVGAGIAVLIGFPAIRRGGLTLPVITLAFALLTSSYLLNPEFFGDLLPDGRVERSDFLGLINISSETRYYYFCLAGLALMYVIARGLRHSRTGRVLIAIRENENAARAYGVNATRTTLAAFAFSGFMAAFAGVLYVHHQNGLGVAAFLPNESLVAFSMVIIGGLGSLGGALLGALYVRGAQYFLPGNWALLASGAGLLLVLMLLPGGIGAAVADARDGYLRWVARRRDILVPSLLADRRVEEPVELTDDERAAALEAAEGESVVEKLS